MDRKKTGVPCPQRARRYGADVRRQTVAWAAKHGAASAAAKYGMTERTVQYWQAAAKARSVGVRDPSMATTASSIEHGAVDAPVAARPTASRRAVRAKAAAAVAQASPRAVRPVADATQTRTWGRRGRRYGVAEKQEILDDASKLGVAAAAVKHAVSRWSVYEWRRRQKGAKSKHAAQAALAAWSSQPRRSPNKLAEDRYHLIAETWLANQALGPRQIRNQLRRTHALRVGTSTVRRVLEEHGYVPPKIKVERRPARRYEAVRPNQQWHLDFIQFYVHKVRVYLLLVEDDYSRFLVGHALCEGERAQLVCEAVEQAIGRHGKPEVMVVDGGSGFFSWRGQSQLERMCSDYGIDFVKAQKLGGNSKLEALNANVRKELLSRVEFGDLTDAATRTAVWVRGYNLERVHEGLGGLLVPADRYFGRADDVLAAIERGEPVGAYAAIAGRALDLFRVKSVGGKPELWFLGERIWPPPGVAP